MNAHNYRQWLFASLVCFVADLESINAAEEGVLFAYNNNVSLNMFCLHYFKNVFQLPHRENAYAHALLDFTSWSDCKDKSHTEKLRGEVVVLEENFCTLDENVQVIQELGGSGIIIIDSQTTYFNANHHTNISVAVISNKTFQYVKALGSDIQVIQYATPKSYSVDFSLVIVWMIAMFCVILGAYWEPIVRFILIRFPINHHYIVDESALSQGRPKSNRPMNSHRQEVVQLGSPLAVVILVICMCIMLLLIYFFYSYLVYVLIALYCLGAAASYFQLSVPFIFYFPFGKLWFKKTILFLLWLSLSITWFFFRHENSSWVLQNFLSVGLLVNVLNVMRFPSFKIITILLMLLFLYDIFFVFITPLFTKNGESVMVEAASGGEGSGGERMPMIFKVPDFNSHSICETHYIFLGLGDVLFPGILVGYCYRFESPSRTKLYFIASVIAYGCGLLITFVALFAMSSAQPALLYLVPTMVITVAILAAAKREFKLFYNGTSEDQDRNEDDDIDTTGITDPEVPYLRDEPEEQTITQQNCAEGNLISR